MSKFVRRCGDGGVLAKLAIYRRTIDFARAADPR